MSSSKIVSDKDVSAYERWELPAVQSDHSTPMTAGAIEQLQKQAYEEGFKQGHADGVSKGMEEGRASGQAEMRQRCELLDQVLHTLNAPLEQLDRTVVEQLSELAVAVARQIIRRELRTDPGHVIAAVREGMEALPTGSQNVRIYLHPEDAEIVRNVFSVEDDAEGVDRPWRIIDDPVLTRGDCRIQSEFSYVDASVEKRLNRIIASMLGGEREDDNSGA
jgi:flagellar assembly protein FliH